MGEPLMGWLEQQSAQVKEGLFRLPVSRMGVEHVDEIVCIASKLDNSPVVILGDWSAGVQLLSTIPAESPLTTRVRKSADETVPEYIRNYGQLALEVSTPGTPLQALVATNSAIMGEIQEKIVAKGFRVIILPMLILPTAANPNDNLNARNRGVPSNPANSQVLGPGKLVTFHQKGGINRDQDDTFFLEWVKICSQNAHSWAPHNFHGSIRTKSYLQLFCWS